MVLETSNGKVLETSLVCNNIILKNRDDFRAQGEEVWRIVPDPSESQLLFSSINYFQSLARDIFWIFFVCTPPPSTLCAPSYRTRAIA